MSLFLHLYYFYITSFQFKKKVEHSFVCRTIRWYVTVEITFIRKSIRVDEQTTASFCTTPEIMADV